MSFPSAPSARNHVAILMATYNGGAFIDEQLESLRRQTHANWALWVSDDRSRDDTLARIETFARNSPSDDAVHVIQGPQRGYVANFLSLVCNPSIEADFYAFADQDDIWEPGKLDSAIRWLSSVPDQVPAVYCGRTLLVDPQNRPLGTSPLFRRPPSFGNAMVQSIGGGNTMVFNGACRQLLRSAGEVEVVSHDWWTYIVVSACGGWVRYDPTPMVRYRQHGANVVGANRGMAAFGRRMLALANGRFRSWNEAHLASLTRIADRMTPGNAATLEAFRRCRSGGPSVVAQLRSARIGRQTVQGNVALLCAALIGRI